MEREIVGYKRINKFEMQKRLQYVLSMQINNVTKKNILRQLRLEFSYSDKQARNVYNKAQQHIKELMPDVSQNLASTMFQKYMHNLINIEQMDTDGSFRQEIDRLKTWKEFADSIREFASLDDTVKEMKNSKEKEVVRLRA